MANTDLEIKVKVGLSIDKDTFDTCMRLIALDAKQNIELR